MAEEASLLSRGITPAVIGLTGPALTDDERHLLRLERPAGVILFRRNLRSAAQLFELCHDVRHELGPRAAIALDQEGGRVDRLATIGPASPSARALARRGPAACRLAGRITGQLLWQLGVNWNLAPCVDLGLYPYRVSGIGDRSFHREPAGVRRFAAAYLQGLEEAGIVGCLKHFPGHGRARLDSHVDMPRIRSRRAMLERDLRPYRGLLRPSRPIMVAHCAYPALDPEGLPATLSRRIVTDILRKRLKHQGLIVADDLDMGSIAKHYGGAEAARLALAAGNDLVLVCNSRRAIHQVLGAIRGRDGRRVATFLRSLPKPARRYSESQVTTLMDEIRAMTAPRRR